MKLDSGKIHLRLAIPPTYMYNLHLKSVKTLDKTYSTQRVIQKQIRTLGIVIFAALRIMGSAAVTSAAAALKAQRAAHDAKRSGQCAAQLSKR